MSSADVRVQSRFDSAESWHLENPILLAGEIGAETDTGRLKVGNGVQAWRNLPYVGSDFNADADGGFFYGDG